MTTTVTTRVPTPTPEGSYDRSTSKPNLLDLTPVSELPSSKECPDRGPPGPGPSFSPVHLDRVDGTFLDPETNTKMGPSCVSCVSEDGRRSVVGW